MKIHIPSAASNIVDGNSPPSDIQAKEVSFPPLKFQRLAPPQPLCCLRLNK